jgi:putative endonuclease
VDRQSEGAAREAEARRTLERSGLRFRAANVRFRVGEIDLVMEDGDSLVFVEVRYRESRAFGGAAASVTPGKQRRLIRAALAWLGANPSQSQRPCRFDVVALGGGPTEWIRDAFRVDDPA